MIKILLIATGGTISCEPGEHGMRPTMTGPVLGQFVVMDGVCLEAIQLMNKDSARLGPADWLAAAQAIAAAYEEYDGFVVAHGTDTLSYCGAFLGEALVNLSKPVVVTGAQVPLSQPNSDGAANLNDAVIVAASGRGGVFGVFCRRIFDGSDMRKIDTQMLDAFVSPQGRELGEIKGGVPLWYAAPKRAAVGDLQTAAAVCTQVAVLRAFPGLCAERTLAFAQGLKGLVVEAYGIGALPEGVAEALTELAARGVKIVIVSQVLRGSTNMETYEITRPLAQVPNIHEGGLLTTEQAFARLVVKPSD